jgi:hypothetical protein
MSTAARTSRRCRGRSGAGTSGAVLPLQGTADAAWQGDGVEGDALAERAWTFTIVRGWLGRGRFGLGELRAGG